MNDCSITFSVLPFIYCCRVKKYFSLKVNDSQLLQLMNHLPLIACSGPFVHLSIEWQYLSLGDARTHFNKLRRSTIRIL